MKKVLFVCTGNTCRSPMAESVFRKEIAALKLSKEYRLSSAGLSAAEGAPMSENALAALKSLKIRVQKKHKAKRFTQDMVKKYDVIITMTENHRRAIGRYPNVVTYGEILTTGLDVSDPYGCGGEVYKAVAEYFIATFTDIFEYIKGCSKAQKPSAK